MLRTALILKFVFNILERTYKVNHFPPHYPMQRAKRAARTHLIYHPNMKALVTGGNGFIGSHLVELLFSKQYSVRCLVRKTSDLTWLKGLNVELVYGDLFDEDALRDAVKGVDYVYHSAGVTKAKTRTSFPVPWGKVTTPRTI